jgi:hypothetical protein
VVVVKELGEVGLERVVQLRGRGVVTCCGGPACQLEPGLQGGDVRLAEEFGAVAGQGAAEGGRGEVVTDRAAAYPTVLEELLPAAWHRTDQYANNGIEADHGRLKAWLGPMRELNQDRSARIVTAGHAFVQISDADTRNPQSGSQ